MNSVAVEALANGNQIWTNTADTGAVIYYLYMPVAELRPGDRIEAMQQFRRGGDGRAERAGAEPVVVLTPPLIATFPAGSFVRLLEVPPGQLVATRNAPRRT